MDARYPRRRWHDRVYVALGANRGRREDAIRRALALLAERPDVRVAAVAPLRETKPAGPVPQPDYLNTVARLYTALPPEALVLACQRVERRLGRDRLLETVRWGPRPIDLDVILYDDVAIDTPVAAIPHPRYRERPFVLDPLLDLAPDLADPETGVPVRLYRKAAELPPAP